MTHLEGKISKYKSLEHAYMTAKNVALRNGHAKDAERFAKKELHYGRRVKKYEVAEAREAKRLTA